MSNILTYIMTKEKRLQSDLSEVFREVERAIQRPAEFVRVPEYLVATVSTVLNAMAIPHSEYCPGNHIMAVGYDQNACNRLYQKI